MQNYGTQGLALLLTLLATAFYAYCCFLGLNYWLDGKMIVSALCVLAVLVVLGYAMKAMVLSKMHRNAREGKKKELQAAALVLVVFLLGCPFVSKFLEITDYSRHGLLAKNVSQTVETVRVIDSCYLAYANNRVKKLKRVNRLNASSLSRRLMPNNIDSIAAERRAWLDKLSAPNIWNIYTATNIHHLTAASEKWTQEYAEMSAVIYKGEGKGTKPFAHSASEDQIAEFQGLVNELHGPDWRSVLASLVCFAIMMTNYIVTRRAKTGVRC